MKIAVCMKQVPAYSEGNIDEKTGLLIRNGLEAVVNAYDLSALETALRIKEQTGAQVDVFTMGPKRSEAVLREAFSMGADNGYCISHKAFAGADVLATAYTLMQAIDSAGEYELILCGRQTTDGDTAQVGGALARWMEIPCFTAVTRLMEADEEQICFEQTFEKKRLTQQIGYPCLLAVDRSIFTPRMPSLKLKMGSRKKPVTRIGLEQMKNQNAENYGLKGSATRVYRIFPPERTSHRAIVCMDGQEGADYILGEVKKILGTGEELS